MFVVNTVVPGSCAVVVRSSAYDPSCCSMLEVLVGHVEENEGGWIMNCSLGNFTVELR